MIFGLERRSLFISLGRNEEIKTFGVWGLARSVN